MDMIYICNYPDTSLQKHYRLTQTILKTPGATKDPVVASLHAWDYLLSQAIDLMKELDFS